MSTKTTSSSTPTDPPQKYPRFLMDVLYGLRSVVVVSGTVLGVAALLSLIIQPLMQSLNVQEDFTAAVTTLLIGLLPIAAYITGGVAARRHRKYSFFGSVIIA